MGNKELKQFFNEAIASGGKVTDFALRPDGSGCAVMSFPLPADHWLYKEGYNDPPEPLVELASREAHIRAAARYAIRASTMNGKVVDFDPDAMEQNFVIALLGTSHEPGGDT